MTQTTEVPAIDINIFDGETYGRGEGYVSTVFAAFPIRSRGGNIYTDTLGEPLLKVILPGPSEVDDTWVQNTDQERPVFEDKRINKVLDFMFSFLTD